MKSTRFGNTDQSHKRIFTSRAGLSAVDLVVAVAVVAVAVAIAVPWLLGARAAARVTSCRDHLRTLALALHAYHASHQQLPPAAVLDAGVTTSLALHSAKRVDLVTRQNWAQLLLPFVGEDELARRFDSTRPIGDLANTTARTTRLALMSCPDDSFNRDDNPHRFLIPGIDEPGIFFARGNYAINGGTHDWNTRYPTTAGPKGDYQHLVMQAEPRLFQQWGNGIAGFNKSFSIEEFKNGQSTLVALEEIRAGIHPLDPRGTWALGQIGGSVTWAHGVNGDDFAPNHAWERADDILGCKVLHEAVGKAKLTAERMPCVDYVDSNGQATSRSMHLGGVHVVFLDGAVRFVADTIDPGVWHVIHSRETPAGVLAGDLNEILSISNVLDEARPPQSPMADDRGSVTDVPSGSDFHANSLGMTFVTIPAGDFTMGLADIGNEHNLPPECPAHRVHFSRSFLLGAHEVTRGQYSGLMGPPDARRDQPAAVQKDLTDDDKENLPVSAVTWDEAAEFCRRLSLLSEERAAGRWYRLPTEAEWEYGCRSATSEPYRWESSRRPPDQSGDMAGVHPSLPIKPVGSYPPNDLGLFDMRGNVWEWTVDWFDRDYYARSPVEDPHGPARGFIKVVRGGDWRFVGEVCHIDYAVLPPWKPSPVVGFRVVCELLK